MPKGKQRKGSGDGCLFPFRYIINSSMVSGTASIQASPAGMTPRGLVEADAWAHFRVRQLHIRAHPRGTLIAVGFVGGVQDTLPSSVSNIAELLPSAYIAGASTIPSSWIKVPQNDLAGPFPWYKTIAGGADATEEAPGYIVVGGTGTDGYTLEIKGVLEFKTSVATANTPLAKALLSRLRSERALREAVAERARLLKILEGKPAVESQRVQDSSQVLCDTPSGVNARQLPP